MRALRVDLVTAGEVAPVDLPLVVAVDRVGRAGGQPRAGHQAAPDTGEEADSQIRYKRKQILLSVHLWVTLDNLSAALDTCVDLAAAAART